MEIEKTKSWQPLWESLLTNQSDGTTLEVFVVDVGITRSLQGGAFQLVGVLNPIDYRYTIEIL